MLRITKGKFIFILFCITVIVVLGGNLALAQTRSIGQLGIEYGTATGLGTQDIRLTIARIIQAFLGLIGIVLLALIIYGGFLYMTAAGDEEKVDKGKKIIVDSVIGLAIVLSSFAIAQFVISRLVEATTGGGAGGQTGGGGVLGQGLPPNSFYITSITPQGSIGIANVAIHITFSDRVDPQTVNSDSIKIETDKPVPGTFTIDETGRVVEFKPAATCPETAEQHCFPRDSAVTVTVTGEGLGTGDTNFIRRLGDGKNLLCQGLAAPCFDRFITGSMIDTTPPTVQVTSPASGASYCVGDQISVYAQAHDNAGISYVAFQNSAGNTNFIPDSLDAPSGQTPLDYTANRTWDTSGFNPNTLHDNESVGARALDIADPIGTSNPVRIVLRPTSCCNATRDSGETGVDTGGLCGAGEGAPCATATDCAVGLSCVNGSCANQPVISEISPRDGKPGNYVTIFGTGFGSAQGNGTVTFLGNLNDPSDDKAAAIAPCGGAWNNRSIVVVVPQGAVSGPIEVKNNNGLSGNSVPLGSFGTFSVNDVSRPGICAINPTSGSAGDHFAINGRGFGAEVATSTALFGDRATHVGAWSDALLQDVTVPNVQEGRYVVQARVNDQNSNSVYYAVHIAPGTGPIISSVDPRSGGIGTYVTISGNNFGTTPGSILFINSNDIADADISFPSACTDAYWTNTNITVKVPSIYRDRSGIAQAVHGLRVIRADGARSALTNFTVNTTPPGPSVCALAPDNGPAGTTVHAYGERFGEGAGTVHYFNNQNAQITAWTVGEVMSLVPGAARTGPVAVSTAATDSHGVQVSNNRNFRVADCRESGCGTGEQCCSGSCISSGAQCATGPRLGSFLWRIASGPIPRVPYVIDQYSCGASTQSPSPYKNTQDACINSVLSVRFSEDMDATSFVFPSGVSGARDTIKLTQCNSGATFDTTCSSGAATSVNVQLSFGSWGNVSAEHGMLLSMVPRPTSGTRATPTGENLYPNTWYRLTIENSAKSSGGVSLDAPYSWVFKTGASECIMSAVDVAPADTLLQEANGTARLDALAEAANCNILRCDSFSWNWRTERNSGAQGQFVNISGASICNTRDNDRTNDVEHTTVTAAHETMGAPPVQVFAQASVATSTASAASVTNSREDYGNVTVKFLDPKVTSYWPNCDTACVNAEVGVVFNTPMDATTINADTVRLYPCTDESCHTLLAHIIPAAVTYHHSYTNGTQNVATMLLDPARPLMPNTYYAVRASSYIRNVAGVRLTGLNDSDTYFRFQFHTKNSPDACAIGRVEVSPSKETLQVIGTHAPFAATPFGSPDECNTNGQALNALSYAWDWTSDNQSVGKMYTSSEFDESVNGVEFLPSELSSSELGISTDASVPSGKLLDVLPLARVASCSNQCLNLGSEPNISVCGNGSIELGESCDDGNTQNGDGCSETCLTEATQGSWVFNQGAANQISGICGNGLREWNPATGVGEQCDDGNTQNGDGCSDSCKWEGSATRSAVAPRTTTPSPNILDQPNDMPILGNYFSGDGDPNPQRIESSSDAVSGNVSALIHSGTVRNSGSTYGGAVDEVPLASEAPGKTYTISYLAKNLSPAGAATLVIEHTNGTGEVSTLFHVITLTNQWMRYSFTATLDKAEHEFIVFSEEPDRTWLMDDFRLFEVPATTAKGLTVSAIAAGAALCGNGTIGYGEACDDGNTVSGDGCSSNCLNEGSRPVVSVCGNGHLDPGEDCDDGNTRSGDGCSSRCLAEGNNTVCTATGQSGCCGNGTVEPGVGENCDDGNSNSGDGCSSRCLNEGSKVRFGLPSAICGDWNPGEAHTEVGESCDPGLDMTPADANHPAANQGIDPTQYATAIHGSADPSTNQTHIQATAGGKSGTADLTVLCNCQADNECGAGNGCGEGSCCYARPHVDTVTPHNGRENVLRDTEISVTFDKNMDHGSFLGNFILWRMLGAGEVCAGLQPDQGGGQGHVMQYYLTSAGGSNPGHFCPVPVRRIRFVEGAGGTTAQLLLSQLLPADTVFVGEIKHDAIVSGELQSGVRSLDKVSIASDYQWSFLTGQDSAEGGFLACLAPDENLRECLREHFPITITPDAYTFRTNKNNTTDDSPTSPLYDELPDGDKLFNAKLVYTRIRNGVSLEDAIQPILNDPNPLHNFDWHWLWQIPYSQFASLRLPLQTEDMGDGFARTAASQIVQAGDQNGQTALTVAAIFSSGATSSTPSNDATASITTFLCDHPWPEFNNFPYKYPSQNLSFYYCRDSDGGTLLPALQTPESVTLSYDPSHRWVDPYSVWIAAAPSAALLGEFLLPIDCSTASSPSCKNSDAIGFRVFNNLEHQSPKDWFTSEGFQGSPQSARANGYEAAQVGRSTYINAANVVDQSPLIVGNVTAHVGYLINNSAHNSLVAISFRTASPANTTLIIPSLGVNLSDTNQVAHSFNAVIPQDRTPQFTIDVSVTAGGTTHNRQYGLHPPFVFASSATGSVPFTIDNTAGTAVRDFTFPTETTLSGASQGYTNTYVLSYNQDATPETINIANQVLKNLQFNTNVGLDQNICVGDLGDAVVCSNDASRACVTDNDCGQGNTCGFKSCASDSDCQGLGSGYACRANKTKIVRNTKRLADSVTLYRALASYNTREGHYPQLGSGSFLQGTSISTWPSWQRTLGNALGMTLPVDPLNKFAGCANPYDENTCWDNVALRASCPAHSSVYAYEAEGSNDYVLHMGFEKLYPDTPISWTPDPEPPATGAGGARLDPNPAEDNLRTDSICGDTGVVFGSSGRCGDGVINSGEKCELGQTKVETCDTNDIPSRLGFQVFICNATCHYDRGSCQAGRCGDGVKQSGEVCDDGNLNGQYGKCNTTCTALAAYCGDGLRNGSEFCDRGFTNNGDYCGPSDALSHEVSDCRLVANNCSWDCRSLGPRCGDGITNGPEECDGNTQVSTNVDVNHDGTDDVTGLAVCPDTIIAGITRHQVRSRGCDATSCQWPTTPNPGGWSVCAPVGICGDGKIDPGEECDDGNTNNTDACISCRKARCGDGYLETGVEQCDAGSSNAVACTPEYGSSCSYCTGACTVRTVSGAFCGNGIQEAGEACDITVPSGVTCASQGYPAGPADGSPPQCNSTCSAANIGCRSCWEYRPGLPPDSNAPNSAQATIAGLIEVGKCLLVAGSSSSSGSGCVGSDCPAPVYDEAASSKRACDQGSDCSGGETCVFNPYEGIHVSLVYPRLDGGEATVAETDTTLNFPVSLSVPQYTTRASCTAASPLYHFVSGARGGCFYDVNYNYRFDNLAINSCAQYKIKIRTYDHAETLSYDSIHSLKLPINFTDADSQGICGDYATDETSYPSANTLGCQEQRAGSFSPLSSYTLEATGKPFRYIVTTYLKTPQP